MVQKRMIVFVCEHGAAKSVVAATYFNQLAQEKALDIKAIARGTNPDPELSAQTINGLFKDGLAPLETVPRKLSLEDVRFAQQIVSFCALPTEFQERVTVEHWDNIPAVSENYDRARDVIIDRLNHLLDAIRSSS